MNVVFLHKNFKYGFILKKIDHSDYAKWSVILTVIFGKTPPERTRYYENSFFFKSYLYLVNYTNIDIKYVFLAKYNK